jgi:hypothetical protein
MATATAAAAGTALALYYYSRGAGSGAAEPRETHAGAGGFAPRSFMVRHPPRARPLPAAPDAHAPQPTQEDLYYLAEALKLAYGETLGRWRTADLLVGLVFLARRTGGAHPAAGAAAAGRPYAPAESGELARLERCFMYIMALRERAPLRTRAYLREKLGLGDADVLRAEVSAAARSARRLAFNIFYLNRAPRSKSRCAAGRLSSLTACRPTAPPRSTARACSSPASSSRATRPSARSSSPYAGRTR